MTHDQDLFDAESKNKTKAFHKGAVIYKEGQGSNAAYIIKQGEVALYRIVNNKRVHLGRRGAGRIFGEMGIISGGKRTATAEALDYTEVIILDQALLKTLLLKSPRPVQIIAGYLVERVKTLSDRITDRPSGNIFLSVCNILALCHRAAQTGTKNEKVILSQSEISRTIKEILLISQLEIDEVLERLQKLAVIEMTDVKGAYYRKEPLFGEMKKSSDFLKDRTIHIPDVDKFQLVTKNLSRELKNASGFSCDLEYIDLAAFAAESGADEGVIYRKMAYKQIPSQLFFFHKPAALDYIERMGPDFFRRVKKPRLKTEDLETIQDIVSVDNATLQDVFSRLGFRKVAVLAAMARDEARDKVFKNLSQKIANVVRDEISTLGEPDEDEAADVEDELIELIKNQKGLSK